MLNIQKEKTAFKQLSHDEKLTKIENHLAQLSYHYDYFRDLEVYVKTNKS